MREKILVVDDEPSIVTLLEFNLQKEGFTVITASDGQIALEKFEKEQPDLIVLDLMLPGIDGYEVCRRLREKGRTVPLLMLTAKDEELDKILGLELGADDYITKPFSPREVVARVRAILRRSRMTTEHHNTESEKISAYDLVIYPQNYEAYFKGEPMELTPKEFELLVYLARHKGRVLTREQLLNAVWNYDFVGDTRIVDVHVSHLRDKIEDNAKKPKYIKTVRGMGYKFEEPVNG